MKDMQNSRSIYVYNKLILGKLHLKKGSRGNMEINSYFIIKVFFFSFYFFFFFFFSPSIDWMFFHVNNKNG